MADGFIIKRGSQGGTKQVDSVEKGGEVFYNFLPPNIIKSKGYTYSSNTPPNVTRTNGQAYPQT